MVRITNRFLMSTEKFIRARFGAAGWEKFMSRLETDTRSLYHFPINPKGNVGFDHVGKILKLVEEEYKTDIPKILYELGLHNSADDLSATQRLLMKLISVEWVLKAAALLWKQRVINGGTMQIEHRGKGHVNAKVTGFEQPIPQWWEYLTGWFTSAIQFSGGKYVNVQWLGGGTKPTDPADFDARWQ